MSAVKVEGDPTPGIPVLSEHLRPPVIISQGFWGGKERRRHLKALQKASGKHSRRVGTCETCTQDVCGKLSAATQSGTGESEEADHANHHQGDGEIKQQSPTKEERTA